MTRKAATPEPPVRRASQPIPETRPLELAPTDYQPSKAELEEEFDMPGMTMDEVRHTFRRPFKFVRRFK